MVDDLDPMLPYLHQVRLIDRQHRWLFELIACLEKGEREVISTIGALDSYVDRHFRVEEEILETLEYRSASRHHAPPRSRPLADGEDGDIL
jgi:hemerythrin